MPSYDFRLGFGDTWRHHAHPRPHRQVAETYSIRLHLKPARKPEILIDLVHIVCSPLLGKADPPYMRFAPSRQCMRLQAAVFWSHHEGHSSAPLRDAHVESRCSCTFEPVHVRCSAHVRPGCPFVLHVGQTLVEQDGRMAALSLLLRYILVQPGVGQYFNLFNMADQVQTLSYSRFKTSCFTAQRYSTEPILGACLSHHTSELETIDNQQLLFHFPAIIQTIHKDTFKQLFGRQGAGLNRQIYSITPSK